MSKTINSPGGIIVRFIEALNGFKSKYGYWPSVVEAEEGTIAFLATESLTPFGFFLRQSKVDLVVGESSRILAKGKERDVFDYGEEGWQSEDGHSHDAVLAWARRGLFVLNLAELRSSMTMQSKKANRSKSKLTWSEVKTRFADFGRAVLTNLDRFREGLIKGIYYFLR